MNTINRSALVVKPAQPFLDWLHRVDPTSTHLTLSDIRLEPTIYLLPEWEADEEALKYLAEVCDEIFEEQLNGWHRVPSVWPGERDLKSFLFWFDCSFHSMVIDLSSERLRHIGVCNSPRFKPDNWTLRDITHGLSTFEYFDLTRSPPAGEVRKYKGMPIAGDGVLRVPTELPIQRLGDVKTGSAFIGEVRLPTTNVFRKDLISATPLHQPDLI